MAPLRTVYFFGPFALHAAARRLLRNRDVVPLASKSFEILLLLVQSAGKVVPKDEILRRVWPKAIVEESNLTQTMFVLRKALGDTVRDPRYITTVPTRGYCFVADVREAPEPQQEVSERASRELIGPRYAERSETHKLCLKGRHFWEKRTAVAVEKAIRCFQQAVDTSPQSALAYAGLADCYAILSHYSKLTPGQTLPKAKAAALRALAIDDTLAEAHASLALVKMLYDWDWPGAGASFRRAIEINGRYATAHHWYGLYLAALGRFDEAIAEVEYAQQVDPLSLAINTDLGLVLYLARRYDEAVAQYRAAIDLDPAFSDAQEGMLMASNEMGMYCQPISEFMPAPAAVSREVSATLDAAYRQSGVMGYWRAYLALTDAPSSEMPCSPYVRARIYAKVGDTSEALRWLDAALAARDGGLSLLRVDPCLDGLRASPAFVAILERVGLA